MLRARPAGKQNASMQARGTESRQVSGTWRRPTKSCKLTCGVAHLGSHGHRQTARETNANSRGAFMGWMEPDPARSNTFGKSERRREHRHHSFTPTKISQVAKVVSPSQSKHTRIIWLFVKECLLLLPGRLHRSRNCLHAQRDMASNITVLHGAVKGQ